MSVASEMLWKSASFVDENYEKNNRTSTDTSKPKYYYYADSGDDLSWILREIVRSIMKEATVTSTVKDELSAAFYPVDSTGVPLGDKDWIDINGKKVLSTDPTRAGQITYNGANDTYTVTWSKQDIPWEGWHGSIYVKAKEDFMGGNNVSTNVEASFVPESYTTNKGTTSAKTANFSEADKKKKTEKPATPYVNVDELHMTENSTEWTVYLGTEVDPAEQLTKLWDNIMVNTVVDTNGMKTGYTIKTANDMYYEVGGPEDKQAPTDGVETIPLSHYDIPVSVLTDLLTHLKDGKVATAVTSDPVDYAPYGQGVVGSFIVTLTKTVNEEAKTDAPYSHKTEKESEYNTTDGVYIPVESYVLSVTYLPKSEDERKEWLVEQNKIKADDEDYQHHGGHEMEKEAREAISTNTHTISVFQKGIKITKVDMTNPNQVLTGATFALYRVDDEGTADVSGYNLPSGNYSLVSDTLEVNDQGEVVINPVIPDKDSAVIDKTLYEPNIHVGATTDKSHDTVFYLVEKKAPEKDGVTYATMPGAIKFTMTLTENKGDDITATLYNWTQAVNISAEEYETGSQEYLVTDGETDGIYAYRIKNEQQGTFKITKQVTYNHEVPENSTQKSKLAGTYTFTVYTDADCENAYQAVPGTDLTVSLTIDSTGAAKTSEEITLPPGDYWIKENEPGNDTYAITEILPVTIKPGKTGQQAAVATFTNNINEGEDQAFITVRKTFSGLASKSEIPDDFSITVTNGTDTYTLLKNPTESNITWSESQDGFVWTWQIFNVTPGTTYTVNESNEEIEGYTVTSSGTGSSQSIAAADINYTVEYLETKCSQKDWPVNENTMFAASMTNKTGGKGTLIVTKDRLSVSERKAVEEKLLPALVAADSNVWKKPVHYYSIQDNPTGFKINAGTVTYNLVEEQVELSDTDIWQHVASVSFIKNKPDSADFNVTNTYQKKDIDISLVKVDVNHLNDIDPETLPGATFTIEKYISLNPANKDTEWGTNGSVTKADTEGTGMFSFADLTSGYYKIVEDVSPDGYIRTTEAPVIEVRVNESTGELEVYLLKKGEGNTYVDVTDNNDGMVKISNKKITVGNEPGAALPNTGGPGTTALYLIGILLTAFAGAGLAMKKRRKAAS